MEVFPLVGACGAALMCRIELALGKVEECAAGGEMARCLQSGQLHGGCGVRGGDVVTL